ncbi:MAG: RrF2 family transcriptional regulator [Ruminococcus sp.]|jgi:Rrf2 family protein
MLLTRESDYAIRIVRALKDGGKIRARDICECEEIPEAFAYKILKKLEKAEIIHVSRGTRGGCTLVRNMGELTLYDVILAIEPEFSITHCMREGCSRNTKDAPCAIHEELQRIQNMLEDELKSKSFKEILDRETGH